MTDYMIDQNGMVQFAHGMGLISDELHEVISFIFCFFSRISRIISAEFKLSFGEIPQSSFLESKNAQGVGILRNPQFILGFSSV